MDELYLTAECDIIRMRWEAEYGVAEESVHAQCRGEDRFVEAVLAQKQRPSRLHSAQLGRSRYDDFVEVHTNAMSVMMQSPPAPSWGHMAARSWI